MSADSLVYKRTSLVWYCGHKFRYSIITVVGLVEQTFKADQYELRAVFSDAPIVELIMGK